MAVTTVSAFLASIKRFYDYNITDTDLDSLLLDYINEELKVLYQDLYNAGYYKEITREDAFKTIANQPYRDPRIAVIVGNVTTFTGIANDKINVTIDSTEYADIDISASTSIADVVTAINTATGGTEASEDVNGYLQILSTTAGATSNCTIANGTTTGQTVVGDLFSTAAERTSTGLDDIDDTVRISERVNFRTIEQIPWRELRRRFPDPTREYTNAPRS